MAGCPDRHTKSRLSAPDGYFLTYFAMITIKSLNLSRLYTVHPQCPTILPSGTHLWLPTSTAAFLLPTWTHLQDETTDIPIEMKQDMPGFH